MQDDDVLDPASGEPKGDDPKGGAGDKGGEAVKELRVQMDVLTKAVTLMAQGQKETQDHVKAMATASAAAAKKDEDDPAKKKESITADSLFEGVDLEQLDRKEYGALLMTKFLERIQEHMGVALKPLQDHIGSLEGTVKSDLGSRQISAAAQANGDLYEWKEEIAAILKETPNMKLARALVIARSENPEKAKAMLKKYSSAETKKNGVQYLSLTPTSRTGASDEKAGRMKFPEAAERAFDDML